MNEILCLPSGDPLPLAYRWIRAHGLRAITPWHFTFDDRAAVDFWRDRYSKATREDAWPFASPQDRMEVAALPLRNGKADGSVIVVDTDIFDGKGTMSGTILERYHSFIAWFSSALRESEQWMTEEELKAVMDL